MSKRNAIVKTLPVVESLGCATVVCSDKTGTLTQNEMTARAAFTLAFPRKKFGFSGVGYASTSGKLLLAATPEGISPPMTPPRAIDATSEEFVALAALFTTACLCNNATVLSDSDSSLAEGHSGGAMSGQPTELALLVAAEKANVADPRPQYHRIQEVPFSSERKRMEVRARPVNGTHCCKAFGMISSSSSSSSSVKGTSRQNGTSRKSLDGSMYFVKGMPESILAECSTYTGSDGSAVPLNDDSKALVMTNARRLAGSGLRVLAMAYGTSLEELTFCGVVGMEDPPREGVAESVQQLRHGGVRVMMVTGDSKETALAIARRCGIVGTEAEHQALTTTYSSQSLSDFSTDSTTSSNGGGMMSDIELGGSLALSGAELDAIAPQDLPDSIANVKVFYRVAPRHKLAIVRALQEHGDIVAMTGDGECWCVVLKFVVVVFFAVLNKHVEILMF
jgi:Ca2+-transporting ATPase